MGVGDVVPAKTLLQASRIRSKALSISIHSQCLGIFVLDNMIAACSKDSSRKRSNKAIFTTSYIYDK